MFLHFHTYGLVLTLCSSLPFTVLGVSCAGGTTAEVREARPPDNRGATGDHQQVLQAFGVMGREATAVWASSMDVGHVGAVGTRPGIRLDALAVLPDSHRAAQS